jgi:hypothetical protein
LSFSYFNSYYFFFKVYKINFLLIILFKKGSYTYENKGKKRVKATSTGNEKTRLTVCFAAAASGEKLKPLIIVPRVNPLSGFEPPSNVVVLYDKTGNMNNVNMVDGFINKYFIIYFICYRSPQRK